MHLVPVVQCKSEAYFELSTDAWARGARFKVRAPDAATLAALRRALEEDERVKMVF